jgi:N-acetyl-gamma-glutamyl-phosphate reductase
LLEGHPSITLELASQGRGAGGGASIEDVVRAEVDVLFSCLPSGLLGNHLPEIGAGLVIDVAGDHRSSPEWVYGLTEFVRSDLPVARVANPGCYPTAALLVLLPFAAAGLIAGPVTIDGLSGASGAGRSADETLLLAALHGNARAYGPNPHRHVAEMERGLADLASADLTVSFTPHLLPIARGLLVTAHAPLTGELDDAGALAVLHDRYRGEPFVRVAESWPETKAVAGTNNAHLSARIDARANMLVCSSAIDNLGKGAAGQAVQNANLCLGLEETAGLEAIAVWP